MSSDSLSCPVLFDAISVRKLAWDYFLDLTNSLCVEHKHNALKPESEKKLITQFKKLCGSDIYWAFPGYDVLEILRDYMADKQYFTLHSWVEKICTMIASESYRLQVFSPYDMNLISDADPKFPDEKLLNTENPISTRPYFETLVLRPESLEDNAYYVRSLSACRAQNDEFVYQTLCVTTVEDALIAILANPTIQSCVILPGVGYRSRQKNGQFKGNLSFVDEARFSEAFKAEPSVAAANLFKSLRTQIDLYFVSDGGDAFVSPSYRSVFKKIIFSGDSFLNVHYSILGGIRDRYDTPFFNALQAYTRKPKGVFHALPVSRGSSLVGSHWIKDLLTFYGPQIFLAETSSTHGGLDSLLDPKGPIKQAHDKVSTAFGSQQSYFVTNGTSTSNKIVTQSLLKPGDIALISSDCHKSISYSVMLSGAYPLFLNAYELPKYAMFGAVNLDDIKRVLISLKKAGQLDKVKMIILTNSTFDGLIYHTERYMEEILAIKPDMVFHWDEAWFSFAHFNPIYKERSAMSVAKRLTEKFGSDTYKAFYKTWKYEFDNSHTSEEDQLLTTRLYPDPEAVTLRVYATQSTHKTLTSFRQGSMIHIWDMDFESDLFVEAYYTHTSTSPNYQIIASLDVGRRQVALEGYELVRKTIELAMSLRWQISHTPLVSTYFKVLTEKELVPQGTLKEDTFKPTKVGLYGRLVSRWKDQAFVVDPTRVSVDCSQTGLDGTSLQQLLINRFDIQVNKTATNSVLFIVNIGATEETVAYLLKVLTKIAEELEQSALSQTKAQLSGYRAQVKALSSLSLPLPSSRLFFSGLVPYNLKDLPIGDVRAGYYMAYDKDTITYRALDQALLAAVKYGEELVSAAFVTPYPPGFPVLVPGQLVTFDILNYLIELKVKEIHGLKANLGLKLFTKASLASYIKRKVNA